MIFYVTGSLFESPAQTLVNTVNTGGVMGKGIALTFKQIFPQMFEEYQELCEQAAIKIGTLHLYRTPNKTVLNFPTKESWRKPSRLEYIEAGLKRFVEIYQDAGIHSAAFPPLGCGNGELSFNDVRPLMEKYLSPLPIPIYIYPPFPADEPPEHRRPQEIGRWLREQPSALPFKEVWADLREILSEPRTVRSRQTGKSFQADFVDRDPDPYVRVLSGNKTEHISTGDVKQLWGRLRHHAVVTPESTREGAYLFPLLAELPYVRLIRVAASYEKFSTMSIFGLQLVGVPPKEKQTALALAG